MPHQGQGHRTSHSANFFCILCFFPGKMFQNIFLLVQEILDPPVRFFTIFEKKSLLHANTFLFLN